MRIGTNMQRLSCRQLWYAWTLDGSRPAMLEGNVSPGNGKGVIAMSIFPKHVTKKENVIIHLKFINESKKTSLFYYHTQIINPFGKIIMEWNDKFIMSPKTDESINQKEFYYEVNGNLLTEAGKYLARTNLFINGRLMNSRTEKNDYFFVDEVSFCVRRQGDGEYVYELFNLAGNSNLKCSLIKTDGTEFSAIELGPKKSWKGSSKEKLQLRYENHSIQQGSAVKRYVKNPRLDYRVLENELQLFDDDSLEVFSLPNALAFLWLKCDGILTPEELAQMLQLDEKVVHEMLEYLIQQGFLVEMIA